VQREKPLVEGRDDYVISLLRTRTAELDVLERRRQEGTISLKDYLSCRRALLGTIADLRTLLLLASHRIDVRNEIRGEGR
jgi:hypothetical protein